MGAIAGAVGFVGPEIERAVRVMVDALGHRGREGAGVALFGTRGERTGAILGAAYSNIIGPGPRAKQPMVEHRAGAALVYNGSVYNYRELRSELEHRGETFESASDTEVVLKACAAWRDDFLERLEGMFALAVWDPEQRIVLMARDRFGLKPLYWGEHRGPSGRRTILFASEVRALLRTGLFPRRIDPVSLEAYAWNGCVMSPRTIVQGIHCLPPGKCVSVSADTGHAQERRYWFLGDYEGGRGGSDEIGDALRRAVERQLRSDVPVGLFLSGGMDSSAIVALASEISQGPVRTFNVGFEETELDESAYARAVASALGTDHTEIRITQQDFEDSLDASIDSLDQPTFDGLNTYLVSRAVRAAGIRVALGGTGGDDLFGGNRTFVEIPFVAKWGARFSAVPESILRAVARVVTQLKTGSGTIPAQARWGKLSDLLAAKGNLLDLYQLTYALFTPEFIAQLLGRPLSRQLRAGVPRAYADEIEAAVARNPELYAISMMELILFLGEKLLRDLDSASSSVGLEVRVPFLDDGLIEVWRGTSPETAYQSIGKKKVLLDTALSGLDPSLFDRPKAGFVLPLDKWCRDGLGDTVEKALMDADHCRSVGLDPQTTKKLWLAFKRADSGLYWSRVWSIFVYLRVCRREGLSLEPPQ